MTQPDSVTALEPSAGVVSHSNRVVWSERYSPQEVPIVLEARRSLVRQDAACEAATVVISEAEC